MGPKTEIGQWIHETKYRSPKESFEECMVRVATALADDSAHKKAFLNILLSQRFLPGGRIQAAGGSHKAVTYFNCFMAGIIDDSMEGIMKAATDAALTMRQGGGIGYNFGTIRPKGTTIKSLDSQASGPVSFMGIFDAVCKTIASAGHRRGAQMGILPVTHPDILEFIRAKQNTNSLTAFNISVGITDDFMRAVESGSRYKLTFAGRDMGSLEARAVWQEMMESTFNWAEPGVVFLDTCNRMNNISYCETITGTNPCGEIPMGPHSACLLGSFNLTKYVNWHPLQRERTFNWSGFTQDIGPVVRALDNVNDRSLYPLEAQKKMALAKRRLGIGITGLANAGEALGMPYGGKEFLAFENAVLQQLANISYEHSAMLARDKDPFPMYQRGPFMASLFVQRLDEAVKRNMARWGMRNSHLLAIAPTGTISLSADNVSGGVEPVFAHSLERTIQTMDGPQTHMLEDYAVREWGVKGKTTAEVTVQEHLDVLTTAQKWVDQAISKTVNVPASYPFEDFKRVYMDAWKGGAKGLSTFRNGGMRSGILKENSEEGISCKYDPTTGVKTCD